MLLFQSVTKEFHPISMIDMLIICSAFVEKNPNGCTPRFLVILFFQTPRSIDFQLLKSLLYFL